MKSVKGKALRGKLITLIILAWIFFLHPSPFTLHPSYAQTPTPPSCNPSIRGDCPAGLREIEEVFTSVISVAVGLGFIVALVMLVWAGFKYLTSGGEPKAVQAAHHTFTWALLGILFLAIAWLVLKLVEAFTEVQVTGFNIRALCGPSGQWCR